MVKVNYAVINYNPTSETHPGYKNWYGMSQCPTPKDLTGYNKLKDVMFGFIAARGGRHTFLYSYGYTYEAHWNKIEADLYEKKSFRTHNWLEGILMVPPDNGVFL